MNVVIVESAAKAKTINKYLGSSYRVIASFGHVRDLPSSDGSVEPDNDFQMHWEVDGGSRKVMSEITEAVKKADKLILATDPDREGEAISWHILEILAQKKARGAGRARPGALKDLGPHPEGGGNIQVMSGRYGPYVKFGKVNATLPKDMDPQTVSIEQAIALIAERAGKSPAKKSKSKAKPAAEKKVSGKKPAAKKAAGKAPKKSAKGKKAKPAAEALTE